MNTTRREAIAAAAATVLFIAGTSESIEGATNPHNGEWYGIMEDITPPAPEGTASLVIRESVYRCRLCGATVKGYMVTHAVHMPGTDGTYATCWGMLTRALSEGGLAVRLRQP